MKYRPVGRPRLCPEQSVVLERYTLRLDFSRMRFLRRVGEGNFSEGVRRVTDRVLNDEEFMREVSKKAYKEK